MNLARCAYADADLVLLDNALSAVDHHTAHHIFDKCIKGLFSDKAVVLVTHQIEFMPRCDNVAIMDEGRCLYFGKWNEEAQHLLGKLLPITHLLHAAGSQEAPPAPKKKAEDKAGPQKSQSLQLTLAPTSIGKPTEKPKDVQKLSAYQAALIYTWYGNLFLVGVCFFFFLAAQCSRQISDFWVRWWVNDEYKKFPAKGVQDSAATTFYCLIYLLLVGLFYIFMIFRGATFLWWVLKSSETIRRKALHNVLNAPMGFFLVTPVGDLLLNFTKDQDIVSLLVCSGCGSGGRVGHGRE